MKKIIVLTISASLFFITACKKTEEEVNITNNGIEDNLSETIEATQPYPFTGLSADENLHNRAIAVMINNQTQARPQSGLSEADIVFELLTEGNITRFLAIFQSSLPE